MEKAITRVVSLWLPSFTTDRLSRSLHRHGSPPSARTRPLVTVTATQGGLRVAAADLAARAAGIAPGLTLADARALVPDLKVTDADPQADIQALAALADWCGRYTPYAAVDGSGGEGGGLWLDITGCAHLFGGEAALLEDARARLARFGFIARAVAADTPGAAWAVARTAAGESTQIIAPDGARQALAELPVVGLRLPAETVAALERLGLACIGDLYQLPRAPLVARFGDALLRRLDQALGRAREPLSPRIPAPPLSQPPRLRRADRPQRGCGGGDASPARKTDAAARP